MGVRDDLVRLILWAGVLVGFVTAAASLGDPRHLRCMTCGGAALMVFSLAAILRSVFLGKTCPAIAVLDASEVADIMEAPSAARRSAENSGRLDALEARADCHAVHLHEIYRAMQNTIDADGRDCTQPMRRLRIAHPAQREGSGSLCGAVGARVGLVAGGP